MELQKQIVSAHTVPFWFVVLSLIISVGLASLFWLGWAIWLVGFCVIAAWMPLVIRIMTSIYRKYGWLSLLFVLLFAQTLHFFEHLAQMYQIHLIHLPARAANGIIGALNNEWVHFIWNSWVLIFAIFLMFLIRKNIWLIMLFIFAIWHEIEHAYIMSVYLRTNLQGNPGLIARGGLIGGGLPITRPDLHFLYAVLEEGLLLLAYFYAFKKQQSVAPAPMMVSKV